MNRPPTAPPPFSPPAPPSAASSLPEPRYAELRKVLNWLRQAVNVIAVLLMVSSLLSLVHAIESRSDFGRDVAISQAIWSGSASVLGWLWSVAAIGLIRVLIDIEANTRAAIGMRVAK